MKKLNAYVRINISLRARKRFDTVEEACKWALKQSEKYPRNTYRAGEISSNWRYDQIYIGGRFMGEGLTRELHNEMKNKLKESFK